jgi:hypothetical protein
VLVSNLLEMRHIVGIARLAPLPKLTSEKKKLAELMKSVLFDSEKNALRKRNLIIEAKEPCWKRRKK